jgi:hypothetical protein
MKTNYLKRYCGQTLEITEDVAGRNQDGLKGRRKKQENWDLEIGGRMPRIEDGGGIYLRRPRPTQGCSADDDYDDDDDDNNDDEKKSNAQFLKVISDRQN